MHYLERLIRRALAVPRDQEPALFDPFEQVAAWEPEPETVREPSRAVAPDAAPTLAPERPVPPSEPVRVEATMHSVPDVPVASSLLAPDEPAPQAKVPLARAAVEPDRPAVPTAPLQPAPPSPQASLARADAFMRSLGVQRPPIETHAAAASTSPVPPAGVEPVRPQRAPPRAAPSAQEPALLRPVPPHVPLPQAPAPVAGPRSTALPAREAVATASRRPALALAPERIVQTTVVVAPPSRRLEDLAHSSGIARFGLNQW